MNEVISRPFPDIPSTYIPPGDPRPDQFVDSGDWGALLATAYAIDGDNPAGVFWALQATRCLGAALWIGITDRCGHIGKGEMREAEYQEIRRDWLAPRAEQLRSLLASPATWVSRC